MDNEVFYVTAATVIPLLLIAVMATRSLRVGQFSHQPIITTLVFGLPVIGELATFAFMFFEPVPAAAAVILALVTWAGLLSQLGLAAWWLAELVAGGQIQLQAPAMLVCPVCHQEMADDERESRAHLTSHLSDDQSSEESLQAWWRQMHEQLVAPTIPPRLRRSRRCPTCNGIGSVLEGRGQRRLCPMCSGAGYPKARPEPPRPRLWNCPMCGSLLADSAAFCTCGHKVVEDLHSQRDERQADTAQPGSSRRRQNEAP
jgi:hypothetical protein